MADGSRELVYSNFTTLTIGASIPDVAVADRPANFLYNKIVNTGLIYGFKYRKNGTEFMYFRNNSAVRFDNGKFKAWLRAPTSFWVWCDKSIGTGYTDYICTNSTTMRINNPLPA